METNDQSVELTDTITKRKCFTIYIGCFYWIILMVSIIVLATNFSLFNFISILIGNVILGGVAYIIYRYEGTPRTSSFYISHEGIELIVPQKGNIRLNWSDLNHIYVKKRKVDISYSETAQRVFYDLKFNGGTLTHTISIESRVDFRRKTIKKILDSLESFAAKNNKGYHRFGRGGQTGKCPMDDGRAGNL